jgi:hypothetical protein
MTLVTTTHIVGRRPLGVGSQQVIDGYPQLIRVIESRLGAADAALFARPERRPDPSLIDWHTAPAGPAVPLGQLSPDKRAAVEAEVEAILDRVRNLAASLQQSGASAHFFGEVLARVVIYPGPDSIFLVGERPVLVLWGFEAEKPSSSLVPKGSTRTGAGATELGSLSVPAEGRSLWAALWRWLLLLLMLGLLLLLLLKACAPLPPTIVAVKQKPRDLMPDIGLAESQSDKLFDELRGLQSLRQRELATCVLPPPPAPVPVPVETKPEPPPPLKPPQVAQLPKVPKVVPKIAQLPKPPLPVAPKAPQTAALPPATPPPAPATRPNCVAPRPVSQAPEVVMIVDSSGSMGLPWGGAGSRMDAAKRSIGEFVDGLPTDIDVGLIGFGGCGRIGLDPFYPSPQRALLKGRVNSLMPMFGTPLGASVDLAGHVISGSRPGIIVVVSDGNDTCHGDPCAAARQIAAFKPNVKINVIDIGDEPIDAAQCMARATGGRVYQPNTVAEMETMMRQASGQPDVRLCRP